MLRTTGVGFDIDRHDSSGVQEIADGGEVQRASTEGRAGLDNDGWSHRMEDLLVEPQIERTLEDGVSHEVGVAPGHVEGARVEIHAMEIGHDRRLTTGVPRNAPVEGAAKRSGFVHDSSPQRGEQTHGEHRFG